MIKKGRKCRGSRISFVLLMSQTRLLKFFHDKEDSDELKLTKDELYDLHADEEDYRNQKEYRDASIDKWRWAGSVYNVIQQAEPDDRK